MLAPIDFNDTEENEGDEGSNSARVRPNNFSLSSICSPVAPIASY